MDCRKRLRCIAAALWTIFCAGTTSALALPLTTTISATGSGTLGAASFNNASFAITSVGDTAARQPISSSVGFYIDNTTASINISGIGLANFTLATRIFVNNTFSVAGFSRAGAGGDDILDVDGAPFTSWNMLTNVGPIFDADLVPIRQAQNLSTTLGSLSFSSYSNATFQAVIPEPTCAGTSAALLSVLKLTARRRRNVTLARSCAL